MKKKVAIALPLLGLLLTLALGFSGLRARSKSVVWEYKLLGPFRGLVCAYRWTRVHQYQIEYRYEEVVEVTEGICRLQPHVVEAWDYLAWNLAFNLFVEAGEDLEEKWTWLKMGLDKLNEGLSYNPQNSRLLYAKASAIYLRSQSTPAMLERMKAWMKESPKEKAAQSMLASNYLAIGNFNQVEMVLVVLRWAGKKAEIVEACKKLVNRFPSSAHKFEELQSQMEQ